EFGPPPPQPGMGPMMPGYPDPPGYPRRVIIRDDYGPGPAFLNAPGQAARTVGAVISRGTPVNAGVITADGTRSEISSTAAQQPATSPRTTDQKRLSSTGLAVTASSRCTPGVRVRRS